MKLHISAALIPLFAFIGLDSANSFAMQPLSAYESGLHQIQYQSRDGFRGYDDDRDGYRGRRDERREDYGDPRDYRGPKWRPGQVLPGPFLFRVVEDWEDRGLSRPPGGHEWVRVGQQFILVRVQDRMIARILNFD